MITPTVSSTFVNLLYVSLILQLKLTNLFLFYPNLTTQNFIFTSVAGVDMAIFSLHGAGLTRCLVALILW